MRMYFDIVDQSKNDACLNLDGTITSLPSEINKSCTIQCPDNYGIVITKNIFGVTQFNKCEVHEADKHCTTTIATALSCHQNCSFFYSGNQLVAPCGNKIATFQYFMSTRWF
ncbi:unnamed protein product [Rotaria socialis]|uniref:Uncharacterized protein n=1 Tax=Rotaria socialis TaxID=392032 RepID=A0A817YXQ2_9BILA|nr:unnamed protein product [Rotaria socialis]